jgi:phytoene dehydrogenase-like protein
MTPPNPQKIVVLGAGPAGISAAWRLTELGHPVTVLEQANAVGGMGKTITVGNYDVDYGPHTFHIRETEESRAIHEAIRPFFGEDPLILTRGTRVLLRRGATIRSKNGASEISGARCTTCASESIQRAYGGCRRRRSPRSRRSASRS